MSLHIFQSTIPVEAYTREACMIDALGKFYAVMHLKRFNTIYTVRIIISIRPVWRYYNTVK